MQSITYPFPPEECVRRGKEIYERVVKPRLKPEDDRKFVSVDILSEDYELDHDGDAVIDRLRLRRPQGFFWGGRVGRPTAYQMLGMRIRGADA